MAEVSQVRTVNSAWFKTNGRRPSRQSHPEQEDATPQSETDDTSPLSSLDDSDSPPHIDEYA